MEYQWYPGHMTKARRMIEEQLKLVDLVIEIADARIPVSSRNPDIDTLISGKRRVLIFGKYDLADPVRTKSFLDGVNDKNANNNAIAIDLRNRKDTDKLNGIIREVCREKVEHDRKRGIINRPVKAMVLGIPNVGKSTLINAMAGKSSAKVGNKPGVTKGKQWISIGSNMLLLDTPGILWPKFEDRKAGIRLALIGSMPDDLFDRTELAYVLTRYLMNNYFGAIEKRYSMDIDLKNRFSEHPGNEELSEIMGLLAAGKGLLKKGGEPDTDRAAAVLLDDFRSGKLGRISLE
ncbi:MAG: ribosome biogenesis GTPase YlqF [Lachnospiraceae bacterium]|nr:ribosome biogenesis GTPase YlqF [Lachnospiraceae bacterium]MDD4524566.1 ribosome biogenesis GTPase YlqF [Lachnospiraceae bacterium]